MAAKLKDKRTSITTVLEEGEFHSYKFANFRGSSYLYHVFILYKDRCMAQSKSLHTVSYEHLMCIWCPSKLGSIRNNRNWKRN